MSNILFVASSTVQTDKNHYGQFEAIVEYEQRSDLPELYLLNVFENQIDPRSILVLRLEFIHYPFTNSGLRQTGCKMIATYMTQIAYGKTK